jgi:hypothetical protein
MSKIYKTKKTSSSKLSQILSEVVSTPLERVLKILQDLKTFLKNIPYYTLDKQKDLEWVINIISNRMLYNFELSNQEELMDKYKSEFPKYQHLLELVNEYTGTENENLKFNQLIKKTVKIIENQDDKSAFKELGLQMPSMAYIKNKKKKSKKMKKIDVKKYKIEISESDEEDNSSSSSDDDIEKKFMKGNLIKSHSYRDLSMILLDTPNTQNKEKDKNDINKRRMTQLNNNVAGFGQKILKQNSPKKKLMSIMEKESSFEDSVNNSFSEDSEEEEARNKLNFSESDDEKSFNNNNQSDDEILKTEKKNYKKDDNIKTLSAIEKFKANFNTTIAETKLIEMNYDPKKILNKDFNIHEFRKIVGYNNVLPLVGKYIFQKFCLGDKVINTSKLDKFFTSLSNGYIQSTLYHNAIHASDVTQTAALMILNSNFEEIAFTNITDILSIITACLGHDLGHPGVNNQFLINTSNELAVTYNDISPLENFHTSNLFKIIKVDENNILDKVSNIVFKSFRKRVINSILATDMVQHGKVLTIIKSKVDMNDEKNKNKLVAKDSKNIFEEQQALIDFMIHSCDLAHNAKNFNISLKWVELLSNEFWKQGDKETKDNLTISFLCDRNNIDIPKSQVGFIKAFIIPTFEVLVNIFPTLNFFSDNVVNNLTEWKKLNEKGRKRGWTPEKNSKVKRRDTKVNTDINKVNVIPKNENNNNNKLLNKFSKDIKSHININLNKK